VFILIPVRESFDMQIVCVNEFAGPVVSLSHSKDPVPHVLP